SLQCMSIQRQISLALHIYADDHDEWFVPVQQAPVSWMEVKPFQRILGEEPTGQTRWSDGILCPDAITARSIPTQPRWMALSYGMVYPPIPGSAPGSAFIGVRRSEVKKPSIRLQMLDCIGWAPQSGRADYITLWDVRGEPGTYSGGT